MTQYTIVNQPNLATGQPEDISVILSNLQAIQTILNGNVDDSNVNANAAIDPAKLKGYPANAARFLRGDGLWSVPAGYGTTLPASPADGQEYVLVDNVANPTYQWRLRYNTASSSPYKWEYVGGCPWFATAYSGTWQQFSGSSNWVGASPSLAVPRAGDYWIDWGAQFACTAVGITVQLATYAAGAVAGLAVALMPTQVINNIMSASYFQRINGMAQGTTLQPGCWASGTISQLANLSCRIWPARVS